MRHKSSSWDVGEGGVLGDDVVAACLVALASPLGVMGVARGRAAFLRRRLLRCVGACKSPVTCVRSYRPSELEEDSVLISVTTMERGEESESVRGDPLGVRGEKRLVSLLVSSADEGRIPDARLKARVRSERGDVCEASSGEGTSSGAASCNAGN